MIYFYLPNFFVHQYRALNISLIQLLKTNPECFYDDIAIGGVYGSFPGVVWNGGRTVIGDCSVNQACEILSQYAALQIPLRFTYTNVLLDKTHLEDPWSNIITSMANTGNNEIIVNSLLLESYLRTNYSNYKFISSTTKCILDNDDIEKEAENYYLTVLDYRKNPDIDFLKTLKHPEKYELLINAYCNPKCSHRADHYMAISEFQLQQKIDTYPCILRANDFFSSLKFETVIKNNDLYNIYVPMGFKHFKIEGRTNHLADVLESYLYYMVKPEYIDSIRYTLLKQIM